MAKDEEPHPVRNMYAKPHRSMADLKKENDVFENNPVSTAPPKNGLIELGSATN